jgi:hypothetical protein
VTICAECRHARVDKTATSPTWAWKCAARVPRGNDLVRDRLTGKLLVGPLPLCVERNSRPDDCPDFAPLGTTVDDFATIVSGSAPPWPLAVLLAFLAGIAVCGLVLKQAMECVP